MDPIIPQPEQLQVQPPKHFLNKKFAITLVILLLLGGGAYAGIWYWQNQQVAQEVVPTFTPRPSATPDVTADWKTYTNTKYGFSFKYPSNFVIKESIGLDGGFLSINPTDWKNINNNNLFEMSVIPNSGGLDIKSFFKDNKSIINEMGDKPFSPFDDNGNLDKLTTTLNFSSGEVGYLTKDSYCVVSCDIATWAKDKEVYMFFNRKFEFTNRDNIFQTILSTFKFTDSVDTSTWKTYTNTQYGFIVKYPLDYRVNPYGAPTGMEAVRLVQTGLEGTDLPVFSIWIFTSSLSPEAWLKTTTASSIVGDMTSHRVSTYTTGQRTIVDATPTELGTHARVFSEGGKIVMFADVSGVVDPVPLAIQSFKFTK